MSRIREIAASAAAKNKKLLIPYVVAGDPDLATTLDLLHQLVADGADIIELGIPFSDPSSDGPVIQLGVERALAGGITLKEVLELVAKFRETDTHTPVVLMGYLNPIERMGYEAFVDGSAAAGVDGVLVVDMPPAEAEGLRDQLQSRSIDTIFLVAPTTTDARCAQIAASCSGYLYYVSLKGVTGAALLDSESVRLSIERLRGMTQLPIVIGFGIKDADSAKAMGALADGVIIGSALVERVAELGSSSAAEVTASTAVIREARAALEQL
jgi:tryptophan synthase alpha chain